MAPKDAVASICCQSAWPFPWAAQIVANSDATCQSQVRAVHLQVCRICGCPPRAFLGASLEVCSLQGRVPGGGLGDTALMVAAVAAIERHAIGLGGGHGHVGGQLVPAGALRRLLELELHGRMQIFSNASHLPTHSHRQSGFQWPRNVPLLSCSTECELLTVIQSC